MTNRETQPIDYNRQSRIFGEIRHERHLQDLTWGEQNHENGTGLTEPGTENWARIAQTVKRICEAHRDAGTMTYLDVLWEETTEAFAEKNPTRLRAELIQVAAVAVCWIEKLDRDRVTERVKAILDPDHDQGHVDPRPVSDDGFDRRPYPTEE